MPWHERLLEIVPVELRALVITHESPYKQSRSNQMTPSCLHSFTVHTAKLMETLIAMLKTDTWAVS